MTHIAVGYHIIINNAMNIIGVEASPCSLSSKMAPLKSGKRIHVGNDDARTVPSKPADRKIEISVDR